MSAIERLDRFQRGHPRAGLPIAVVYKFVDDQGNYLAALITYYGFISLVPLLLLTTTVTNFVLEGHPDLQQSLLNSVIGQFPHRRHPAVRPERGVGQRCGSADRDRWHALRRSRRGAGDPECDEHGLAGASQQPAESVHRAGSRSLVLMLAIGGLSVIGTTALTTLGQHRRLPRDLLQDRHRCRFVRAERPRVHHGVPSGHRARRLDPRDRTGRRRRGRRVAGAAVRRCAVRRFGRGHGHRREQCLRPGARAAGLDLSRGRRGGARRRVQHRPLTAALPACAADPVHRCRRSHGGRPGQLHPAGPGPAGQGLRDDHRGVRPTDGPVSSRVR